MVKQTRQTQYTMMSPDIQAIINAWMNNDIEGAIGLTNSYTAKQQIHLCKGINARGEVCNRKLAPQAKCDYCKDHKHQDPLQKERVRLAKQRKREQAEQDMVMVGAPA